jgi:hypothetical protein
MMLEVMDRRKDWAVIVALIGGGQEINRGEAGLAEWGNALAEFPQWDVLASPYVLTGDHATAGFRLFESGTKNGKVQMHDGLHLRIYQVDPGTAHIRLG